MVADYTEGMSAASPLRHNAVDRLFSMPSMYDADKQRLLHRYRAGEAGLSGQLADYAYLVQGLLDLYDADFNLRWLRMAIALTESQVELFYDHNNGGFFATSGDDKSVLVRMKEDYDGAEPAANSVAALNLARLSNITGNGQWAKLAEATAAAFAGQINTNPTAMPKMLTALGPMAAKPRQIVITGPDDAVIVREMIEQINRRYLPDANVLVVTNGEQQGYLGGFMPFIKELDIGKPAAYVCEDFVCKLPVHTAIDLAQALSRF